ncbi:MAG: [FeFe] hydrogenase H-cluster radical SAM maturase HydG [Candidatus Marinimicrobia bacterium]|nr:[FeFe] hydrogenase H-cluster radical SAM maturase HydG [Candidatus Neomarinimicrobiota bacterium]
MSQLSVKEWTDQVIKQDQIDKYLIDGEDFIDEEKINKNLKNNREPNRVKVRDILQKSLEIERLSPAETATLLNVQDEDTWQEMYATALEVKKKVYDNRIVFFAPLYLSNLCVNNCAYCGFRKENKDEKRKILSKDEIIKETEVMVREGHKRMIAVWGEHPRSDIDYMVDSMKTIYDVERPAPHGPGRGTIRRININAAPMSISDLRRLWEVGVGTYQVFQETYHKPTYRKMHPPETIKGNYRWRLYALHRAMEAGIDDVATGVLFGLYDWRFEVMSLLYHAIDLERQFGIGPHTISFPRLMHAAGSEVAEKSPYLVNDQELKKIITVLRLAVPYTGLIITARENADVRSEMFDVGVTQTDASTRIGIGGYSQMLQEWSHFQDRSAGQKEDEQQFILGDTRRLDEVIGELAEKDIITSFCTAGYRCGRTGEKIMGLLCNCVEGKFCKLNAILTYREYLDDYAFEETRQKGMKVLEKELNELKEIEFFQERPEMMREFYDYYERISNGERDLFI